MKQVESYIEGTKQYFLPYSEHFECLKNSKDNVIFYGNGKGYPEVSGGRPPEIAHLIEKAKFHSLIETLGPRFEWTANSTCPRYTRNVKEMLRRVAAGGASVVVADFDFANRIKQDFPDIPLTASCIMSLTMDFKKIRSSGLFHRIVTPQFWNYDFDKIGQLAESGGMVTIVNSRCDHSEDPKRCLRHYNYCSKVYSPPPQKNLEVDWSVKCELYRFLTMNSKLLSSLGKNTLSNKLAMYQRYKPEKFPPWKVVIQELNRLGFMLFKFEGRSFASLKEWAGPIVSFIEAN